MILRTSLIRLLVYCCAASACLLAACSPPPYEEASDKEERAVVIWISVDGLHADYLARTQTPFFDQLKAEGAYSLTLAPTFPSLSFPVHASQATGVPVNRHGVSSNVVYDREQDRKYWAGLPYWGEAEPIWETVRRQGLRVATYDWLLTHNQESAYAADYVGEWDTSLNDQQRLERLFRTWRNDRETQPLQLLMGYMKHPDVIGHAYGPDAPEIIDAVDQTDRILRHFLRKAVRLFNARMSDNDVLYVIVSSDHGMADLHTHVHPLKLFKVDEIPEEERDLRVVAFGPISNIFFDKELSASAREERSQEMLDKLEPYAFARGYLREDMPSHWKYNHPNRVGDLVVLLDVGYAFSDRIPNMLVRSDELEWAWRGHHGYDATMQPEMNGVVFVWSYPRAIGGHDMGETGSLHLHATVCALLGIEPAERADPATLPLPEL